MDVYHEGLFDAVRRRRRRRCRREKGVHRRNWGRFLTVELYRVKNKNGFVVNRI